MKKRADLELFVLSLFVLVLAIVIPTETEACSNNGFGQFCTQTIYTYDGVSAQTAKAVLFVVAALCIAGGAILLVIRNKRQTRMPTGQSAATLTSTPLGRNDVPAPAPSGFAIGSSTPPSSPRSTAGVPLEDAAHPKRRTKLLVSVVPHDITAGPDGNLWFTATRLTNSGRIGWIGRITLDGQVTEFPLPNQVTNLQPTSITKGPDGNLWFVLYGDTNLFAPGPGSAIPGQIGRITTGGVMKVFPAVTATSNPVFLATGPDGNVWFTDTDGSIGRITPDGQITEFPVPNALPYGGIAAGADGNMWFAASGAIGRITSNGKATLFPTNFCPNVSTCDLAAGPDGNLWFTATRLTNSGRIGWIGRITLDGQVTEFPLPNSVANLQPTSITKGPDGNLWFTIDSTQGNPQGVVGRITPGGSIAFPVSNSQGYDLGGITVGPDGNLWFTGQTSDHGIIVQMTP